MAMENKRIIQLSTERTNLTSGDYVMVDSDADGSAKYRLDRLKETDTTLSVSGMAADAAATGQAISAETQARTQAVTAETQARQQAIIAESQARSAADTTLGNDVQDLKSALNYKIDEVENVYNCVDAKRSGYYNASGTWVDNNSYFSSDYIPVNENEIYCLPYTQSVVLWDINKSAIGTLSVTVKTPFKIPENPAIKYLTFFGLSSDISKIMFIKGNVYPLYYLEYGHKTDTSSLINSMNNLEYLDYLNNIV